MKQFTIFTCAVLLFVGSTAFINDTSKEIEAELQWHEKLAEAQVISKKTNKPIFAFFTGSDWCGWCHRLQATVFAKPEFKQWANENVVLLELDFPRRKKLDETLTKQNDNLRQMFAVRGYPTGWLVMPEIVDKKVNFKRLGSQGYVAGGPSAWIKGAEKILEKK